MWCSKLAEPALFPRSLCFPISPGHYRCVSCLHRSCSSLPIVFRTAVPRRVWPTAVVASSIAEHHARACPFASVRAVYHARAAISPSLERATQPRPMATLLSCACSYHGYTFILHRPCQRRPIVVCVWLRIVLPWSTRGRMGPRAARWWVVHHRRTFSASQRCYSHCWPVLRSVLCF